ncbi:hypothetical protein AB6A40_006775 [Gnathostoma spinigerum]|uniref:Kinesin-like protein KIF2A-like N-terminal domain-containing protein n=1 Tax=Gnathostoma spinigerum TaxID=75299 RepID=A0ABD6ERI9_9BILA
MERINVGMHVDIRRSNGRVHNAIISEVKKQSMSVTVEWFENGETKGKEVDLQSLISLNPTLAPPRIPHPTSSVIEHDADENTENIVKLRGESKNEVIRPRSRNTLLLEPTTLAHPSDGVKSSNGFNARRSSSAAHSNYGSTTSLPSSNVEPSSTQIAPMPTSINQGNTHRGLRPPLTSKPRFMLDPELTNFHANVAPDFDLRSLQEEGLRWNRLLSVMLVFSFVLAWNIKPTS